VKCGQQARASRMIKMYIIIKKKPVLISFIVLLTSDQILARQAFYLLSHTASPKASALIVFIQTQVNLTTVC
jgi:hypothetical protein